MSVLAKLALVILLLKISLHAEDPGAPIRVKNLAASYLGKAF